MSDQDVAARYAPMIDQIAKLYADDANLFTHLKSIRVYKDEWDSNRAGGHFWFTADESGPPLPCDIVDTIARDLDGSPIGIIIHFIGGYANWAEWFRYDIETIACWPPASVEGQSMS